MFKKIILSLFVFFAIISFTYTSNAEKVDLSKYEIIYPVEKHSSTTDKNILINGKAPTGSNITLDIYITTDLTKKNFNLSKLPEEDDYISTDNIEIKSGNMGFFQHEVSLVLGINKIIINYGIEELSPEEFLIYVYENSVEGQSRKGANQKRIRDIVPLLK